MAWIKSGYALILSHRPCTFFPKWCLACLWYEASSRKGQNICSATAQIRYEPCLWSFLCKILYTASAYLRSLGRLGNWSCLPSAQSRSLGHLEISPASLLLNFGLQVAWDSFIPLLLSRLNLIFFNRQAHITDNHKRHDRSEWALLRMMMMELANSLMFEAKCKASNRFSGQLLLGA